MDDAPIGPMLLIRSGSETPTVPVHVHDVRTCAVRHDVKVWRRRGETKCPADGEPSK
jgi:hypothetical protein